MKKTIVINIFGGPGTGKSTLAAGLFYEMKKLGFSVELALEYAKALVWEGRDLAISDQIYIFAKQQKMLNVLSGQVDFIICDSPIILSLHYGLEHGLPESFNELVLWRHNSFDNLNFFITDRPPYEKSGRRQKEAEAKAIDRSILSLLGQHRIVFSKTRRDDFIEKTLEKIKL